MSIPPSVRRPAGVEPLSVRTRRGPRAALAAGRSDDPLILLVPGFTGSKEDFLPILRPLADAGLRAVAFDQLGQYESPGTGTADSYSLAALAGDVVDLLPEPAHVVGHSLGGLICREACLTAPELFRTLVLLDSGPGALPEQYWPQLGALRDLVPIASLEQIWQLKEELDREAEVPPPPRDVHEFLHARWLANDPWCLSGMAEILMTAEDRTDELARILADHSIPAAVAFGADDTTSWPVADMAAMAGRLGVPAFPIADAAHSPAVENPTATAAQLLAVVHGHPPDGTGAADRHQDGQ